MEGIYLSESSLDLKKQVKIDKENALNKWHKKKITLAHDWIENEETQMKRTIVQGAIHLCDLGENIGSEQNGERPALIVSTDRINTTSGNVKIIPLSKRLKKKTIKVKGKTKVVPKLASHYFLLRTDYPFLDLDSAAKAEELTTVNKIRLKKHIGNITSDDLNKIKNRIKWVFDI